MSLSLWFCISKMKSHPRARTRIKRGDEVTSLLVIDDDALILEMIRLAFPDYEVAACSSAQTEVLRHTDGNLTQAAKRLGITRTTLRARLETLGMSVERSVALGQKQTE
jgi:two-component system nitrogen regulation response regulator GlnG